MNELVAATHDLLRALNATVAVAESLTGGLLTAALTSLGGSSDVVRGGLVVYATDLKAALAGVDPALLAEVGAVHPDVAEQLACGVRSRLGAGFGLSVTGVAGPAKQDGVPVGTVYMAVSGPLGDVVRREVLLGSRHDIRHQSVELAVDLLYRECARSRAGLHSS